MTPTRAALNAWRFAVVLISGLMAGVIVASHVAGDGDPAETPQARVAIPADDTLGPGSIP